MTTNISERDGRNFRFDDVSCLATSLSKMVIFVRLRDGIEEKKDLGCKKTKVETTTTQAECFEKLTLRGCNEKVSSRIGTRLKIGLIKDKENTKLMGLV